MIGAIAGDVVGSRFEAANHRRTDFELFHPDCRFTDDTVLTLATAEALLGDGDFSAAYRRWFRRYPDAGYGASFRRWALSDRTGPYGSFGNGSAMRVSPVAEVAGDLDQTCQLAESSAAVTHDHPEGIRGAMAVASAVWLARQGRGAKTIRSLLETRFGYRLEFDLVRLRAEYEFDVSCQGSVPRALWCALEADSLEAALRLAVSIGGDSDTIACMAGALAEARFGAEAPIVTAVRERLDPLMVEVLDRFQERFG